MKGRESRDPGLAAFDSDGNQFDFTVALGGSTIGYRTPDSTHILLTQLTETAICRISIQRPGQGAEANGKRLEVICPWHGDDELDLAPECVQQFSTALRLYKPVPFSIARWQRTRAGRSPRQNTERYSLKGTELRRFRNFALRLLDFHVSRNLFRHARYLPDDLEDDVRNLLGGSREHEARVLMAEPHVMIAASGSPQAPDEPPARVTGGLRLPCAGPMPQSRQGGAQDPSSVHEPALWHECAEHPRQVYPRQSATFGDHVVR
jgi:hypothetical protein